jgi:hypothetical protein
MSKRRTCQYCEGTGIERQEIYIGEFFGYEVTKIYKVPCHMCEGRGTRRKFKKGHHPWKPYAELYDKYREKRNGMSAEDKNYWRQRA